MSHGRRNVETWGQQNTCDVRKEREATVGGRPARREQGMGESSQGMDE